MPGISNSKLKLLYLMKIFLQETDEEHDLSAAELLERLAAYGYQAERKSLYDDIETLRSFGLDIIKKKSKSYSYYLSQREFQLPELRLLVDAVQSSKFITHRKSAELIRKVETLCSRHQAADLQRQVYVANRIKTMNESIYYNIDAIHSAISGDCQLSFKYFEWVVDHNAPGHFRRQDRHGGATYHISPWALIWDDENYYMLGFDSVAGFMKHYRVDKMTQIRVTEAKRDGKAEMKNFDVADYTRRLFGMFSGEPEHVKLSFANRLIGVVIDRYGKDIHISKEDEEHFGVVLKVTNSPQFMAWLFSFGDEVRVVYPQHIADELCAHAQAVNAVYNTKEG